MEGRWKSAGPAPCCNGGIGSAVNAEVAVAVRSHDRLPKGGGVGGTEGGGEREESPIRVNEGYKRSDH